MSALFSGVSWLGVIVGAVAAFLLGWIVYLPATFGRKWAEGSHVEIGPASQMPMGAMGVQAAGLLLLSWFVGVTAVHNMRATVILATLAFTVLAWSGATFSQKSQYARTVDAGYWIGALVVMIIAQAIF